MQIKRVHPASEVIISGGERSEEVKERARRLLKL